jgi:protease-4
MLRRLLALACLCALAAAAPAHATSLTPKLPLALYGDESVATTDDARAMLFNPAATGLRYPGELLLSYARYDAHHAWNSALWTHHGVGLQMLRQRDTSQTYGAVFAWGSDRLRFGWSPYWLISGQPVRQTVGDHRIGLLSRPAPWMSAGFTVDHLFQPIFRGERRARWYTLGLGLRPLALSRTQAYGWGTRLTLSGDVTIVDDGEWRQARVHVGGQFEALPGITLRAQAEDHGHLKLGITFSGVRSTAGVAHAQDADRTLYQAYTLSVHKGEERTVLPSRDHQRIALVRVGGALADEAVSGVSLLSGGVSSTTSSRPLHKALVHALEDPLTRGVLLDLQGAGGMAQLEELRPRIERLRAAGKPVVANLQYGATRGDLYLASACDRIVASEEASFAALGLRAERRSYKQALAEWGLKLDRSSIGAFKSAFRNFSVDSTPPADTLAIEHALTQQQAMFVKALAVGRHMDESRVLPFLDGRAYSAADLAGGGLIDSVGYREDAVRLAGTLSGLGAKPRLMDLSSTSVARRAWTVPQRIAVVYLSGGIEEGRSGNDLLTGPFMGDQTVAAQMEKAFHAPGVKAVVLRIESPGGSSLASNLIDHTVQRLKRETHLPVIVSMGGVAGSGGYYIACHADRIWADPSTRTGSIGVLFVKPSWEGFYAKHHVRQEDFQRGDGMAGWSVARDWTPAMQASADSAIARSYDQFVAKVADGRHLPVADVREAAQGRVWMGEDALQRKLIDGLGGMDEALADARARGGIPASERIALLEFGRPRPGLIARLLGGYVRESLADQTRVHAFEGAQARMGDEWGDLAP